MKKKGYNALVIGDSVLNPELIKLLSEHQQIQEVITSCDLATGFCVSVGSQIDIVIIDFFLMDGTALDYLQHQNLQSKHLETVIVLIDKASYPMSLCAYRKGADQVIVKDQKQAYLALIQSAISRLCKRSLNNVDAAGMRVNINHAMIGINLQYQIVFLNEAAAGYLGKTFSELIGKDVCQVIAGLDEAEKELVTENLTLAQSTRQPQPIGCFRLANIDHDLAKVDLMVSPIFLGNDTLSGFIISMQESAIVQGGRAAQERMQNIDAVTGVLNYEALLNRLNTTLSYSAQYKQDCAVLHLDVDGFKAMNDALGHILANQLLKTIAYRIGATIREGDIISRVGADEFIIVLSHTKKAEDSACMADKNMRAFKKPFILEDEKYFLTLSIGIALFPHDATTMENILQCADSAVSLAKSNGKNNYQFYKPDVTREATSVVTFANDLHVALDHNQFELYFQPQVRVGDFAVIGLEALIRWHHPEKGIV